MLSHSQEVPMKGEALVGILVTIVVVLAALGILSAAGCAPSNEDAAQAFSGAQSSGEVH
jgi:hypothetical protein